jgi:cell division protein ZapA (FtsZ GTPase activity inhibitor)
MADPYTVVNLTIQGRKYPVKCSEDEAVHLTALEKTINERLQFFRLEYAQLDKQDCLSMALIEAHMSRYLEPKDFELACERIEQLSEKLTIALS